MEKTNRKFKRTLNIKNVYEKKYNTFDMDGIWRQTFGEPERSGAWLIYGPEKHGKTWFALMLANYMSRFEKTYYLSAEEGIGKSFAAMCLRININYNNKALGFNEYETLPELYSRLKSVRAPRIVVIDNLTIYNDELKYGALRRLLLDFPNTLFIFIAHEEKGEPYTATAKMVKRLAQIIINVKGLACSVWGRCPGGTFIIDEEKAALNHGDSIITNGIINN